MEKYLRRYRVGVGVQGVPLEHHIVHARSYDEARKIGISRFLSPDKGFDHIEVKLVKRTEVPHETR